MISPSTHLLLAKRRARRRRSSAGGTMFVVAMTLAVLSSIGAWALQSSALEVRMAGYERQSTQTHYLAEYGVLAAMQNLSAPQLKAFLAVPPTNTCEAVSCVTGGGATFNCVPAVDLTTNAIDKVCIPWVSSSFIDSASNFPSVAWTGTNPLDPASGITAAPGSLGAINMTGDFRVEVTEVTSAPAGAGYSTGFNFYWATVTSYGQTNQSALGTTINQAASQGDETLRTRIKVGPAQ